LIKNLEWQSLLWRLTKSKIHAGDRMKMDLEWQTKNNARKQKELVKSLRARNRKWHVIFPRDQALHLEMNSREIKLTNGTAFAYLPADRIDARPKGRPRPERNSRVEELSRLQARTQRQST
jgi:hypothetical protein